MAYTAGQGDSSLVRRLMEGDPSVLMEILQGPGSRVRVVVRRKFEGELDREDILEVMATAIRKLWDARDRYDPARAPLQVFLLRIALNEAIDRVKSGSHQSRRREIRLADKLDQLPAWRTLAPIDEGADSDGIDIKLRQDLDSCLGRLSSTEREVLLADASSSGDIADSRLLAEKLRMTEGAVRVARKRGLDKLRQFFVELGYILR